ncbi:MAG: hypothetical protein JNK05_01920 [Myxococcales bacterium]|nr:hypothetical protein [Myxococcales bacterium]
MKHFASLAALALALTFSTRVALAQNAAPPPPEQQSSHSPTRDLEIVEVDGHETHVGRVVEVHPSQTNLVLRTNRGPVTIRWARIVSMLGPSFFDNDTSALSAVPVLGRVRLRVRSSRRQQVTVTWATSRLMPGDHREGGDVHRVRCHTPCSVWVPASRVLVASEGEGIAPAETAVDVGDHGTDVDLHASSRPAVIAGETLAIGAASVIDVALLVTAGLLAAHPRGTPEFDRSLVGGGITVGSGLVVAGVAGLIHLANPTGARSVDHRAAPSPNRRGQTQPTVAPWIQVSPANDRAGTSASTAVLGVRGTF